MAVWAITKVELLFAEEWLGTVVAMEGRLVHGFQVSRRL